MVAYTLATLNQSSQAEFVAALGEIFEQTPLIAEVAWHSRPFSDITDLHQKMLAVVQDMSSLQQLALIRAHPDLGSKARMATASLEEQASAGLDQLTAAEYKQFLELNQRYQSQFGFPFIIAVKHHTKASVLNAFEQRLANSPEAERQQALSEIGEIARLRLLNCVLPPAPLIQFPMPTLLVKNIHTLVTMDTQRREMRGGALYVEDNVITQVGMTAQLPDTADEVLDLADRYVVLPGLVNTHHHFFQTLTRAVPAAQNSNLFPWLQALFPIWGNLTPEGLEIGSQMAAAELMLSGCTTASDHHYIYPNGCTLDDQIRAIQQMGLRFHASRGSLSKGESLGGLTPDHLIESEPEILKDSQRLIEQYHDPNRYAMLRITLAPTSPFNVSADLLRESAALARSYPGVRLHTHLAEDRADVEYSLANFGLTPGDYAESVGWLGEDVWHAHCVQLNDDSIAKFARTGTGVAHCPCSNMRLGSGIAPIAKMLQQGVPVGLGVDGAASNDATNLLQEARTAMLLARVGSMDATTMTARTALELATLGGAKVLGRDDIGALAPGMAADFIAINLDRPALAGAQHDVVAALMFCQIDRVDYSFINGQKVVDQGQLTTLDLAMLIEKTNRLAQQMVNGG
jgi:8-oxoguanine deaminase